MNRELKRDIILHHYKNPFHKIEDKPDSSFIKLNANIESCIDDIDLYIKLEKEKIKEIYFSGEACAVATASTSILLKNINGKNKTEALEYINNFLNMVYEKPYKKEILKEAEVFDEVYKQTSRIKCATLSYEKVKEFLEKGEKND